MPVCHCAALVSLCCPCARSQVGGSHCPKWQTYVHVNDMQLCAIPSFFLLHLPPLIGRCCCDFCLVPTSNTLICSWVNWFCCIIDFSQWVIQPSTQHCHRIWCCFFKFESGFSQGSYYRSQPLFGNGFSVVTSAIRVVHHPRKLNANYELSSNCSWCGWFMDRTEHKAAMNHNCDPNVTTVIAVT